MEIRICVYKTGGGEKELVEVMEAVVTHTRQGYFSKLGLQDILDQCFRTMRNIEAEAEGVALTEIKVI